MAPKLTADQEAILKEFRTRVSDCLDEFEADDEFLLTYLLNKKFKIDKAEKKLRSAVAWRKEMNESLVGVEFPEVLTCRKYAPYGQIGVDKEGDPVWLVRTGQADHKGIWKSAGKDNIFKFGFAEAERHIKEIKENAKAQGKTKLRGSCIIDMADFPIEAIRKPKYINFALEIFNLAKKYYPTEEDTTPFVKKIYIINNKPLYKNAIELAKTFTSDAIWRNIEIFSDNKEKWSAALLNDIPADQIPPHWGGTKKGSDEFCSDVVCPGGKVPESMYLPKKK